MCVCVFAAATAAASSNIAIVQWQNRNKTQMRFLWISHQMYVAIDRNRVANERKARLFLPLILYLIWLIEHINSNFPKKKQQH